MTSERAMFSTPRFQHGRFDELLARLAPILASRSSGRVLLDRFPRPRHCSTHLLAGASGRLARALALLDRLFSGPALVALRCQCCTLTRLSPPVPSLALSRAPVAVPARPPPLFRPSLHKNSRRTPVFSPGTVHHRALSRTHTRRPRATPTLPYHPHHHVRGPRTACAVYRRP